MPTIEIKLYAMLRDRLPPGSRGVAGRLEVCDGATVEEALAALNLVPELCQVVVLNDEEVGRADRAVRPLREGDRLSVFPPIAGGTDLTPSPPLRRGEGEPDAAEILPSPRGRGRG